MHRRQYAAPMDHSPRWTAATCSFISRDLSGTSTATITQQAPSLPACSPAGYAALMRLTCRQHFPACSRCAPPAPWKPNNGTASVQWFWYSSISIRARSASGRTFWLLAQSEQPWASAADSQRLTYLACTHRKGSRLVVAIGANCVAHGAGVACFKSNSNSVIQRYPARDSGVVGCDRCLLRQIAGSKPWTMIPFGNVFTASNTFLGCSR
ncbi:hypothetical protein C7974DRAFT_222965 [Boeremia exigua]|uniref:uncharacterized protein n=1 Tax=Boeremia exigua TaxID=749465 RepID=UPI001E8D9A17|nr:uncharacterized protein C7974DRAFT_222965 [Boeremia exigua]KAH6619907.1 hypothetical protein C7974DRAFT_222965 [Boeremia exigua]